MPVLKDLTGQTFGRLTVISRVSRSYETGVAKWLCRCECGTEPVVFQNALSTGKTKSCGCLQSELSSKRAKERATPPIERILSRIDKDTVFNCWEFMGALDHKGYGRIDGNLAVHRVVFEHFKGSTQGLCVLHRCDNRKCVNPDHLFLGTNAANTLDMIQKGRMKVGSQLPQAKITEDDVREIRARYAGGERQVSIAADYGLHGATISEICSRKRWKHVA